MVTVEVTKDYRDLEKSVLFHKGETHDVTEERADVLVKAGVAKIPTKKSEDPEGDKPKKETRTKKVTE